MYIYIHVCIIHKAHKEYGVEPLNNEHTRERTILCGAAGFRRGISLHISIGCKPHVVGHQTRSHVLVGHKTHAHV